MKKAIFIATMLTFAAVAFLIPSYADNPPPTLTSHVYLPLVAKPEGTATPTATATATIGPTTVLEYTGAGEVNTSPFAVQSSPWQLEFAATWSGYFTVYLEPGGLQVIDQSVQAGRTYTTYVYDRQGTYWFRVGYASSSSGEWTLRVIDYPPVTPLPGTNTPTATATRTATPLPTTVFEYTAVGEMSTPPFTVHSSPWRLEYQAMWNGSFWFSISSCSSKYAEVASGSTYSTYVYNCTGMHYFDIQNASNVYSWTLRVVDFP